MKTKHQRSNKADDTNNLMDQAGTDESNESITDDIINSSQGAVISVVVSEALPATHQQSIESNTLSSSETNTTPVTSPIMECQEVHLETIDSSQCAEIAAASSFVERHNIEGETVTSTSQNSMSLESVVQSSMINQLPLAMVTSAVIDQQSVTSTVSQLQTVDTLHAHTLTTLTTADHPATLLYLLNSPHFPSQSETHMPPSSTQSAASTSANSTVFVPQAASGNHTALMTNQPMVTKSYGDSNSNVIETAMDLANFGDITMSDCMQHPVANAALTLVSLGSAAGQLTHEVVIDESGSSTFISNPAVEGPSITVESTDDAPPQINNTQEQSAPPTIAPEPQPVPVTAATVAQLAELFPKKKTAFREVITQTGSNTEVTVANTIMADKSSEKGTDTGKDLEGEKDGDSPNKKDDDRTRDHGCDTCSKRFYTKNDLKRHTATHSTERPFTCKVCEKTFRTSNEVKLHMAVHGTGTPYKCEFCGKEFRTKGCITSHIKYHIGDKRHKCTICDRAFVKSNDLKRHIAAHNNEKNYKCPECGSAFTRRDNLKAHLLLHSRQSVVNCELCNKEFINNVYLKRHMHIHKQAKKKPYECQWCPKTYEQLEGLRRHIRQHVGDEKFVCEHCAKKFITAIQLKRHLWLSHEQGSPYRRSIL